jgi:hypothetical protein
VLSCLLVGLVAVSAPGRASAAPVSGVGGVFVPSAVRLMDTRSGLGAPARPVGPGQVVSLQLPSGTVPTSATAVRLNVTAVTPTAAIYITVYPDWGARPATSNLNVAAGGLVSTLVTVKIPPAGASVNFYNNAGSVNLVADLVGYDTPDVAATSNAGQVFSALSPTRVLDTRDGTGGHLGRVASGGIVSLQVRGQNGVPASGPGSVVLNLTAVNPSAAGYVTAYPDGASRPNTSSLNFTAGQTIPNLVIAPIGSDGKVDLYNSGGTVDLVADLVGYGTTTNPAGGGDGFGADGALFDPLDPTRVLDTRGPGAAGPVGPNQSITVPMAGHGGVPAGATAVLLTVTATGATAPTYVTVYPGGTTRPVASNLNVPASATVSNQVVVPVGADGSVALYNSAGSVHLLVDLAGYYATGATSPWHTTTAPLPAGTDSWGGISGVACAGTGCVVAGYANAGGSQAAVLLSGSGDAWTAATAPLPADAKSPASSSFTTAPVCPSAGACLAVGTYQTSAGTSALMLVRGYGSTWTTSALPLPAGATMPAFPRLACGPTGCVVTARYHDPAGATRLALITGDPGTAGSAWTASPAPEPAGTASEVVTKQLSVGCGPAACAVLSQYNDTAGVPHPYLVTGSGSSWTAADAPLPDGDSAPDGKTNVYTLTSVFCGPAACAVTGHHQASTAYHAVVLTGDGSTFAASAVPQPADVAAGFYPIFDAVSCPAVHQCVGTVHYSVSGYDQVAELVSGWSGTPWTTSALAAPDDYSDPFATFTLACPTATSCVTAGGYRDIWGVDQLAIGGGTLPATRPWTTQKATPPSHAQLVVDGTLPAPLQVACASATVCAAVGDYLDNAGNKRVELLTGTAGA